MFLNPLNRKNANTIFPEITVASHGIHISEKQRMIILPSDLLSHILHNENEKPETTTTSAISDVAQSIAEKVLDLYPSRLKLYEENEIRPTVTSVYTNSIKLLVTNSYQLTAAIVYIHTCVCSLRRTLNFYPHNQLISMCTSERLQINTM